MKNIIAILFTLLLSLSQESHGQSKYLRLFITSDITMITSVQWIGTHTSYPNNSQTDDYHYN